MTRFYAAYGAEFITKLALVAACYLFWASAPLWWSALRAFGRRNRLVHPWRFVGTAACLSYGSFVASSTFVAALATFTSVLQPTPSSWLVAAIAPGVWLAAMADHPVLMLAALHLALTWRITRALARAWPSLCEPSARYPHALP